MSFTRCTRLVTLLAIPFSLAVHAQQTTATITETPPPATQSTDQPPSHGTYPEIVRLSLVEGDVRVTRGKQDEKLTGNTWERAAAGIPLQSGFNLVTGSDGRAEVEFEDASTLYIAPNSAIAFTNLTTKNGVPHTAMSLLSGTVTTHLHPNVHGETYTLSSPTHSLSVTDGEKNYLRITSYLDGLKVTPQDSEHLSLNSSESRLEKQGQTYVLVGYRVIPEPLAATNAALTAWDQWVAARITQRREAMHAVMKQAGLPAPLPGLADLANEGTFVACPPYGVCWEPTHGWAPAQQSAAQPRPEAAAQDSPAPSAPAAIQTDATPVPSQAQTAILPIEDMDDAFYDDLFPCMPGALWYFNYQVADYAYDYDAAYGYPYDWVVCHTGSWIYRNHRYLWVAGTHKHHRCPVRWVKYHGKLGYVPLHPRDERGKLPVNIRHGVFVVPQRSGSPRAGASIQRVAYDPKLPVSALGSTPKEFRSPPLPTLARAQNPQLEASLLRDSFRPGIHPGNQMREPNRASALTFDDRSQRFMLATRVTEGGRTITTTQPFSSRSGAIRSGASASFGGGERGGYSGGARGGGYSGGSARGGGGYSGGGGGHAGGGGFSGGSAGSSGGASSSSGGGHH